MDLIPVGIVQPVEWDDLLIYKQKLQKMKISKSLLQAILVGVTLGTTATSCSMFDSITGVDGQEVTEAENERDRRNGHNGDTCEDCPGCGLG